MLTFVHQYTLATAGMLRLLNDHAINVIANPRKKSVIFFFVTPRLLCCVVLFLLCRWCSHSCFITSFHSSKQNFRNKQIRIKVCWCNSYYFHLHVLMKACKIPKMSPGAYIFQRPFLRGLFLEGLRCTKGSLRFKIDWASL